MAADRSGEIDAELIDLGYPTECVEWVCDEHRRHCTLIGSAHDEHTCYWCVWGAQQVTS